MADVVRKKGTSALVTLLGCLLFSCGNYQSEMSAYCREIRIRDKEREMKTGLRGKARIELNIEDIALSGVDVSDEYESP